MLYVMQERAVEFFSAALLPSDDDRAAKVIEKTIPMTCRPTADQLEVESEPEDWFAGAPES